jgi:hypothetical protein
MSISLRKPAVVAILSDKPPFVQIVEVLWVKTCKNDWHPNVRPEEKEDVSNEII